MIEFLASSDLPRTAALIATAAWLTIGVTNNMRDGETNVLLLGTMMRMDLLKDEAVLGQGLIDRATTGDGRARAALRWVVRGCG